METYGRRSWRGRETCADRGETCAERGETCTERGEACTERCRLARAAVLAILPCYAITWGWAARASHFLGDDLRDLVDVAWRVGGARRAMSAAVSSPILHRTGRGHEVVWT